MISIRSFRGPQLCLWTLFWALTSSLGLVAAEPAAPEIPSGDKPAPFVRVQRDAAGSPTAMETSIVRFVPAGDANDGLSVELVAAVHVGEKSYYEKLNKEFEQYDALLYELVAPENRNIPQRGKGTGSGHPIGAVQNGMKEMLELEHQLAVVDYSRPNFVHADMSPEEFAKSMADRDESLTKLFFRMMGQGIAQQSRQRAKTGVDPSVEMLAALFSPQRAVMLKRIMAEQFSDLETTMAALDGPEGSTIITERNKVALEVLKRQIEAGQKKIGIFYGAGHLADMQERLIDEFHLKRDSERWVMAWDLRTEKQRREAGKD